MLKWQVMAKTFDFKCFCCCLYHKFRTRIIKNWCLNDKRGLKIHSFGQNSGFGWPYQEIGKVYKGDLPVILSKI